MKVQEVIDLVENDIFYSIWSVEDELTDDVKLVKEGLFLDEHRWYSIATNVYKCEDGFVGITGAYQSFSEYQSWKDVGVVSYANEMIEVPSITYEFK